ncbi:hypothetical protein N8469_00850 [bacterium]|jgi:uncharacterized protein YneF (UPF0154 family)|nr:hypothetical protein [bacterium]
MNSPKENITKLTLIITKTIVMSVVFIAGVSIGVFNILMKSTEHKVNAKTRITSDQSKIVPKNTKDHDTFGYPDRSVK